MNQPSMSQAAESFVALCMCNLDTCRQVAQLALDSTERIEKIEISFARNVVDKSFSAAASAGSGEAAQPSGPELDDWLRAQREIGDTLVLASQQLARTMSDYGNRLNETLSAEKLQGAFPTVFNTEAVVNFWNQAYERYGEMVKGMTGEAEGQELEPAEGAAKPQAAKTAKAEAATK